MRSENTFGVRYALCQNKNKRKDSVYARIACNNSPERELTIKDSFQLGNWDAERGRHYLISKELKEFATY
ncbi:hypothetical protein [Chitinophaga arvensicola]|uniref:Arm DNA-binding domain-containing protein n=1 Tax=Chitinophaga arvensicola TaxID=29529 RepID=A0A1I0SE20_9BACT|nr:hypothetical protein [Chitinophaga arvensicola]SEW57469.1 hypothetical protein SAMN04488122_6798 [Chitinophaga arvensicola]